MMARDEHDTELPEVGRPLPAADRARIPRPKLEDYALCPDHERGADKARVFRAVFDIERDDWQHLHDEILDALPACVVTRVDQRYVTTYTVEVPVTGTNGRTHPVTTTWKIEDGTPHLVSAFVSLR